MGVGIVLLAKQGIEQLQLSVMRGLMHAKQDKKANINLDASTLRISQR